MDYSDAFNIDTLGIYAARFGHLAAWPLYELLTQLAGQPVSEMECGRHRSLGV